MEIQTVDFANSAELNTQDANDNTVTIKIIGDDDTDEKLTKTFNPKAAKLAAIKRIRRRNRDLANTPNMALRAGSKFKRSNLINTPDVLLRKNTKERYLSSDDFKTKCKRLHELHILQEERSKKRNDDFEKILGNP